MGQKERRFGRGGGRDEERKREDGTIYREKDYVQQRGKGEQERWEVYCEGASGSHEEEAGSVSEANDPSESERVTLD